MGYFKNFIRFRCSCCGRVMNGTGYVFDDGAIFCFRCISEINDQKKSERRACFVGKNLKNKIAKCIAVTLLSTIIFALLCGIGWIVDCIVGLIAT